MSVAKALMEHASLDWQWTHISGGARNVKSGSILKKVMGRKSGWPDFVLISPEGRLHCLELKRIGGKLTEDQEAFQLWCVIHGVPYVVAEVLDHAMVAFQHWKCLANGVFPVE